MGGKTANQKNQGNDMNKAKEYSNNGVPMKLWSVELCTRFQTAPSAEEILAAIEAEGGVLVSEIGSSRLTLEAWKCTDKEYGQLVSAVWDPIAEEFVKEVA